MAKSGVFFGDIIQIVIFDEKSISPLSSLWNSLSYEFLGGTQASMSPRRTEWPRGAENYTHFFHKKLIPQQPFIRFVPFLVSIERYLSPLFNEVIFRFLKKVSSWHFCLNGTQVCIFLCVILWFFQENIAVSGGKIM